MAKKKVVAVVYLDVPEEATLDDVRRYIETAVQSWHGSLDPGDSDRLGDPMFDLDYRDVRVPRSHVKLRKKRRRRLIS